MTTASVPINVDAYPVEKLEISERLISRLRVLDVKTVGELRKWLPSLKLNFTGKERRAIEAELTLLPKRLEEESKRRLERAREALASCSKEERGILFRETADCLCASAVKVAVKNPNAALGALLGGVLGAALGSTLDDDSKKLKVPK